MTAVAKAQAPVQLWRVSLFAAALAGAGLPIYIFAPAFFAETYGVSLTAMGAVLLFLRLFDAVQDPVLGWLAERLGPHRQVIVTGVTVLLGLAMLVLFAVPPVLPPLVWFGLSLTLLFSCFSFLGICFYARGIALAEEMGGAHTGVAVWREAGALTGICLAAMAPTMLSGAFRAPYAAFAVAYCILVLISARAMWPEWRYQPVTEPRRAQPALRLLADPILRRLTLIALLNAAPLAVSSTLFLFFVTQALEARGWEGPLLILFFLSAAGAVPIWGRLADAFGEKQTLLAAMILAIVSFCAVPLLGPGDVGAFAAICVLSGAAIGADMTLLPAVYSRRLARIAPSGGIGFGIWNFVNKFSLALAAICLLPALELVGFRAEGTSPPEALTLLTYLYAGVPVLLKTVALAGLAATRLDD